MTIRSLATGLMVATFALTLSGCGAIGKATSSEASLLDKAESATGVSCSQLSIVPESTKAHIDSVHFQVKTKKGVLYKCYYTTLVGALDSDAVCQEISPDGKTVKNTNSNKKSTGNCNALLKAAGRC